MKAMLVILALARAGDGCGSSSVPAAGSGGSAGSDRVAAALERFAAGGSATGSAAGSATRIAAVAEKPAKAAKPATSSGTWKNYFPEDGPRWTAARMRDVIEFENGKDTWDNGSVRKKPAMTYYGDIYVAYRCHDRDGCGSENGNQWTPIGWWLNN
ncbi:MAG TPA: hypothetical protein VH143_23885 [Kofleriaceae bacterium]|jgi:hypothetical protein|nr:hypothetical protein [Kofleriaceae bacterium]